MGNVFSDNDAVKSDAFNANEACSFSMTELDCIKKCYEDIQLNSTSTNKDSPVKFNSILLVLLKKKGILDSNDNFILFLGDAMRCNTNTTLEQFWTLLTHSNKTNTGEEILYKFFSLLLSLVQSLKKNLKTKNPPVTDNENIKNFEKNSVHFYEDFSNENISEVIKSLVKAVLRPLEELQESDTNYSSNAKDKTNDDSNDNNDNKSNNHLKNTNNSNNVACTFDLLKQYVCVYGPCIPKVFETFLTELLFSSEKNPSFYPYKTPEINVKSDVLPNGSCDLIPLSLYNETLQGEWMRLYSSSSDGISFNRMMYHVTGYEGPLCFLIKPQGHPDSVFGFYTSGKWKELNRFYGTQDTFLFSLKPKFHIIRSRDRSNGNYQWLNTKSYGMPHGLGIGGTMENFRLFITDDFENCKIADSCLTFEKGKLIHDISIDNDNNDDKKNNNDISVIKNDVKNTYTTNTMKNNHSSTNSLNNINNDNNTSILDNNFEIDFMEVWACGGEKYIKNGMLSLKKDRELKYETLQKARKVDKAQFFNNAFNQEFLLSNTFSHRNQSRENPNEDACMFAKPS